MGNIERYNINTTISFPKRGKLDVMRPFRNTGFMFCFRQLNKIATAVRTLCNCYHRPTAGIYIRWNVLSVTYHFKNFRFLGDRVTE